jgi:hypothetical protein
VCSSIARLAGTPSITIGTKEEQQIRVKTKFGVERGRTRVEGDRIRVGEFWFISIGLVALNRPWHLVYIGWGGIAPVGLIKSIFESSNQIRYVYTGLTGVSRFRNLETSKSHNFFIRSPIWANKICKLIYSTSHMQWSNQIGHIN